MKDEVILCLGYTSWSFWRQDHDIMLHLARENKVVYVEEQLGYSDYKAMKCNVWRVIFGNGNARWVNHNLVVLSSPPRLPRRIPLASAKIKNNFGYKSIIVSKKLLEIKLKRILDRLKLKPTILWCFEPLDLVLVGKFGEKLSCYRVYDERSLVPSNTLIKDVIEEIEERNIKKIDLIFTSSRMQYEKRKQLHPNVFFVPNAGDFQHFNKTLTLNCPVPDDLREIPHPIIGFVGNIDYRMDFWLLQSLAKAHREYSIVLVGQLKDPATKWKRLMANFENIYLTGFKEKKGLPYYLKFFDVLIIPYLLSESTKNMYPVKVHEYLATGKPVVSTDLPEIKPFKNVVRIAKSEEGFVRYVEEELATNNDEKIKKRIEVARENSWEKRVKEMEIIIENMVS